MEPIDVVIPAHRKDRGVLRVAVRAVLRHVASVRHVFVVTAEPFRWNGGDVSWVPEPQRGSLPTLDDVRSRVGAIRPAATVRAYWLYQQLLKLGAADYIADLSIRFLVVDADVIFLRRVSFDLPSGKLFPYSVATEHNEPYWEAYERLLGKRPVTEQSLIAHHMLFERRLLRELLAEIEQRHQRPWYEAYLDAVDLSEPSSISDWDTYGWWVLDRYPEVAVRRQLCWRTIPVVPGIPARALYAGDFDFVAAHAWARQTRRARFRTFRRQLEFEARAAVPSEIRTWIRSRR